MFNRIERTTPLWNISPNSPRSYFASRERWKRRRNSLLQFLSHKFSSLTIIDNKVYPEIRLLQWEEIYRKPLNSGYSNNQRILFNIYMEFNDYFKSDLIYDSPGKDLIPSEQNGGDDDEALEPSVTIWNRMFVQVKKNSLSSSLFEYVIICELGHQTEFPVTFTRSHSSAIRMNFLLARVACAW